MKKIDSGFSLLELLVVVAIIGVLAAIGTIGYGQYINSTKEKALTANLQSLSETAKTRLSANELGDSPLKTCFDLVEDLTVKNNNSAKKRLYRRRECLYKWTYNANFKFFIGAKHLNVL